MSAEQSSSQGQFSQRGERPTFPYSFDAPGDNLDNLPESVRQSCIEIDKYAPPAIEQFFADMNEVKSNLAEKGAEVSDFAIPNEAELRSLLVFSRDQVRKYS